MTARILKNCRKAVEELKRLLGDIYRKAPSSPHDFTLLYESLNLEDKRSQTKELKQSLDNVLIYHKILHMSLLTAILYDDVGGNDDTVRSFDELSREVETSQSQITTMLDTSRQSEKGYISDSTHNLTTLAAINDFKTSVDAAIEAMYLETSNIHFHVPKARRYLLILDNADDHSQPLARTCEQGFPKTTEVLLEYGADPNNLESDACVRHLLYHGRDPNHKHLQPLLLLELANSGKDVNITLSVCNTLITGDLPIQLNVRDSSGGDTALMIAARKGSLPLVYWLLRHGTDVNALDNRRRSVLYFALKAGNSVMAQEFLEWKRKLDVLEEWDGAILLEAALHEPATVKLLLDAGANPELANSSGNTIINSAVLKPNAEVVKMLIEKKANTYYRDSSGRTPIRAAVSNGNASVVRLLADGGRSLLHLAIYGPPEMLRILLEFGKFINLNQRDGRNGTPLLAATSQASQANQANLDCLKLLVKAGADINAQGSDGETARTTRRAPSTLVCRGANVNFAVPGVTLPNAILTAYLGAGVSTTYFLRDEGASVHQADPISGRVPLHFAAANGIETFQAILLFYRGDMMVADHEGKNCLHRAAQFGNAKTIEFILSKVDNRPLMRARYVALSDSDGWTPLCSAVRACEGGLAQGMRSEKRDHVGAVRSLLRYGADPAVTFKFQHGAGDAAETLTPLILAQECDAGEEIINMLRYGLEGRPAPDEEQSTVGNAVP
ncbi:hypothetical protein G7Y89_g15151 [Cudoniella acicularis]|uniref:Ankyrin repeat protein n=1 Tax=Cudoniella acicularis TaxID=354080 RepID=A0A8H4VML7_9HELO|nr:hypothetical protein G7Y89_g15151 [Cudoniella acicularis]